MDAVKEMKKAFKKFEKENQHIGVYSQELIFNVGYDEGLKFAIKELGGKTWKKK